MSSAPQAVEEAEGGEGENEEGSEDPSGEQGCASNQCGCGIGSRLVCIQKKL